MTHPSDNLEKRPKLRSGKRKHKPMDHTLDRDGIFCLVCGAYATSRYSDATTHCLSLGSRLRVSLTIGLGMGESNYRTMVMHNQLDFVDGEWVRGELAVIAAREAYFTEFPNERDTNLRHMLGS